MLTIFTKTKQDDCSRIQSLALLCYDVLSKHKVSNKRGVVLRVYLPDLQQINSFHHFRRAQSTTQALEYGKKNCVVPVVVSPVFSLRPFSSPSLEYSIFCPASRPELIPTCLPNKPRCNCLSELSACLFFFSPATHLTRNTYLHTKMKLQAI